MGYNALVKMQELNEIQYGLKGSCVIPELDVTDHNYGREAMLFIRECCEDLNFDKVSADRIQLKDSDGKSSAPGKIPYNMERDIDRLSFEKAVSRFLKSGSREDAFDIYYCYCEIFKPFGEGHNSATLLLELLSEHETNASSLLMKHRDHYSHSVYVFLIGLDIFKNHSLFRKAYLDKYGLNDDHEGACHFLEFWGLTSLFHDVGYPFEIAHQQMKAYVCKLDKRNSDENGFSPYVSYKNMDLFTNEVFGDLNQLYADAVTGRLGKYFDRININHDEIHGRILEQLKDRGIHEHPQDMDYLYMDHAYFSALILAKTYMKKFQAQAPQEGEPAYQEIFIPSEVLDAFTAILLHNSFFKFTLRSLCHTKEPLSLADGQPLAYLLMFCDELQCWDRASYGQNSRSGIYAFDFDMVINNDMPKFSYYFDKAYENKLANAKAYKVMFSDGYTKKSGAVRKDRCKFMDDIDEIVYVKDLVADFNPDVNTPDPSRCLEVSVIKKKRKTGLYLSDSNYLNLYEFALALNARYCGAETPDEMRAAFEDGLSLEYKLSNIAQAKGFGAQLEAINCFYTDRAVDYEPVSEFSEAELFIIAKSEHARWCEEKYAIGWRYGTGHIDPQTGKKDSTMRERTRQHHDLVPFNGLPAFEWEKDSEAMKKMMDLIGEFEGLTIYRMHSVAD